MKSEPLEFDIIYGVQALTVFFESESIERNLLMNVLYDGFNLDTAELVTSHALLYKAIKLRMKEEAYNYWTSIKDEQKEVFSRMPLNQLT